MDVTQLACFGIRQSPRDKNSQKFGGRIWKFNLTPCARNPGEVSVGPSFCGATPFVSLDSVGPHLSLGPFSGAAFQWGHTFVLLGFELTGVPKVRVSALVVMVNRVLGAERVLSEWAGGCKRPRNRLCARRGEQVPACGERIRNRDRASPCSGRNAHWSHYAICRSTDSTNPTSFGSAASSRWQRRI